MELEHELQRLLRTRDVAAPMPDPVPAVHAGMRRRRRAQRLQALATGLAVVVVAVAATLVAGQRLADGPTQQAKQPVVVLPPSTTVPVGFSVRDLSFVSADDGWALGAVPCAGGGECSVLLATHDGGRSWERRTAPGPVPRADGQFAGSCAAGKCVRHLRFVRQDGREVGYAYAPDLVMSTDGGRSWAVQPVAGEVFGLEPTPHNVVRLVSAQPGCPGCTFGLETAEVASADWVPRATPGYRGADALLVREGPRVTALLRGHVTGGAGDARSRLLSSRDSGLTWAEYAGDPCSPTTAAQEVDTRQVALGAEGSVVLLCQDRQQRGGGGTTAVRLSSDSGRTYGHAQPIPAPYDGSLVAAPGQRAGTLVVAAQDGQGRTRLLRSTDGAASFADVLDVDSAGSRFLDFTSSRTGTWVGADGRALFRTSDEGQTWRKQPFR
jgi:photosystem II stability/assembly factor-like uncharacterized protein